MGELSIAAGSAAVQCGNTRPAGGSGQGRFQVVAAGGPIARAVSVLLVGGAVLLVGGLLWFGATLMRRGATG